MFRGASAISVDAKGRIAMPARHRDALQNLCAGQLVVTRDLSLPCLLVFPMPAWERLEQDLEKLSNTNPVHQRIKRILMGFAAEIELDSAGRMLLPSVLREQCGLSKDAMLVGQGKVFQLWDAGRWDEQIRVDIEAHGTDSADLPPLSF